MKKDREPHPEVVYLPAIFREIKAGRIRIPAFQRGYVWERSDALELLDSVKNGYPIGSLLFWEADVMTMRTDTDDELPFPNIKVDGIVDFVLDGMQRVSTLYGAFHERPGISRSDDGFAVSYDLRTETFVTPRDETEASIDLRTIFTPKMLLGEQARLGHLPDGDALVNNSIELLRRFQEYLVPVVRIGSDNTAHVVQIFERVNSTGTRLEAVDFMRALTWSQDFDLSERLEEVSEVIHRRGWEIPQGTIAKCIAAKLGVIPRSDEMVKLRTIAASRLKDASVAVEVALLRVIEFLEKNVGIYSYDFVPYEAQFLVLMGLSDGLGADQPFPSWVPKWFWATGFSEWFFGKPDKNVAELVVEARNSPSVPLHVQRRLTADTIMRRQQKKGGAVAMTMVAALGQHAFSVVSGKPIAREEMLREYRSSSVSALFDRSELAAWLGSVPRSDKFVANCVLLSR
ncbi:MAG TPA: DUF262 domain-containing protein, partial [Steroidobacteraceae bacterium]|nr:DUF262 domain-containing protein [Steroidobacteraceae bacterium]